MQLVACGTISMCNTRESFERNRIPPDNPYWSQMYADCETAVQREIALLEEVKRLRALRDDVCVALSGPGGLAFADMADRARQLRANAERYQWLRARGPFRSDLPVVTIQWERYKDGDWQGTAVLFLDLLDAAIDAARGK